MDETGGMEGGPDRPTVSCDVDTGGILFGNLERQVLAQTAVGFLPDPSAC